MLRKEVVSALECGIQAPLCAGQKIALYFVFLGYMAKDFSDPLPVHFLAHHIVCILGAGCVLSNHMVRGQALLCTPSKDGGDVRPIAVGETLRRLASKCACAKAQESAKARARACVWKTNVTCAKCRG